MPSWSCACVKGAPVRPQTSARDSGSAAPARAGLHPCVHGRTYRFQGLKRLLGAADYSKAGDRHAGLAADSELTREAARTILSGLPLSHLYEHPLTDSQGRIDAGDAGKLRHRSGSLQRAGRSDGGELKEKLLAAPPAQVAQVGAALTGVMAAALVRLCDTHELLFLARKLCRPTPRAFLLGAAGTLSSRLQPNHPTDDPRGLTLLFMPGWPWAPAMRC